MEALLIALLVLACPISMFFMHRSHRSHGERETDREETSEERGTAGARTIGSGSHEHSGHSAHGR
jgi:hypothetical protein